MDCRFYQEKFTETGGGEICRVSLARLYFLFLIGDLILFILLAVFQVDYALWFCLGFAICIGVVLFILYWQKNRSAAVTQKVSTFMTKIFPQSEDY